MLEINVLNTIPIMSNPLWVNILFILSGVLFFTGIFFIWLWVRTGINDKKLNIGLILFAIGFILLIVCSIHEGSIPTGKYKYEVTIDKDVSFTDLNSKYNIVEQRGDIYVLEDK